MIVMLNLRFFEHHIVSNRISLAKLVLFYVFVCRFVDWIVYKFIYKCVA